jgi:CubicO group peptidase (beta-lactamase class C family)
MMHSATKSFLSVAVGMAIHEGYFMLQDKAISFFADHVPNDNQDPKLAALTVEDLLTQTSGHDRGASGGTWRSVKTSWIAEFFKIPIVHQPCTFFKYTSTTSFLLSAIIHRRTGQSTWQFLMPRLFQPLGITDLEWDVGPERINPGGNGISCRSSDLLKLAILHLNGGIWEGQRLLPEEWVKNATTSQRGAEYGYHWWIGKNSARSYYAYGLFGQFAFVFPEHDAILLTTASTPVDERDLRDLVWHHIVCMCPGSTTDTQHPSCP